MKTLFCTDGSKSSYNSINNFSKWFNNFSVDLLSVSDLTYLPDSLLLDGNKYVAECKNSTNSIIDYSQDYLTELGIQISGIVKLCGSAVDAILETEKSSDYKFLILGSNGKKGIQKWLGSVSQEVATSSQNSVYISKNKQQIKNILFPISPSYISENMLNFAINNMNLVDANIFLLTVYEMPDFLFLEGNIDSNWISDVERQQQKNALYNLMKVEKMFLDKGFNISDKTVTNGAPRNVILEYIKTNEISLVMFGMKNRKSFSGLIMPSINSFVLENTQSDVIIYKNL